MLGGSHIHRRAAPPRCPYSSPCHSVPQDPQSRVPTPRPCAPPSGQPSLSFPRSDFNDHSPPLHWVTQGTLGTQNYSVSELRATAPHPMASGATNPMAPACALPPAADRPLPLRGHPRALASEDTWNWPCAAPTSACRPPPGGGAVTRRERGTAARHQPDALLCPVLLPTCFPSTARPSRPPPFQTPSSCPTLPLRG